MSLRDKALLFHEVFIGFEAIGSIGFIQKPFSPLRAVTGDIRLLPFAGKPKLLVVGERWPQFIEVLPTRQIRISVDVRPMRRITMRPLWSGLTPDQRANSNTVNLTA